MLFKLASKHFLSYFKDHSRISCLGLYIFSCFWTVMPSLLLSFPSFFFSSISSFGFKQNTILFQEKFWIYYLEFLRQHEIGSIFAWPSSQPHIAFDSYIERLVPRILLWHSSLSPQCYFFWDALWTLLILIIFLIFYQSYFAQQSGLHPLAGVFTILASPIYYIKLYLHSLPLTHTSLHESWFARNPVAILALLLFLATIPLSRDIKNYRFVIMSRSAVFFTLSLTHTYTALFAIVGYLILFLPVLFVSPNIKTVTLAFLPLIPPVCIITWSHYAYSRLPAFSDFLRLYGQTLSNSISVSEIIWFTILISIGLISAPPRFRIFIIAYGLTGILLSNINLITGKTMQTIHYRLYAYDWLITLCLFSKMLYSLHGVNLKRLINLCTAIVVAVSFSYYFNFISPSSQTLENPGQVECFSTMGVAHYLYYMNPLNPSKCLFMWDVPTRISDFKPPDCSKYDAFCWSWRSATTHLLKHP